MGPLSAMATTRVFSAMPSSLSLSISSPMKGSMLHSRPACRLLLEMEHFFMLGRKLLSIGQLAT